MSYLTLQELYPWISKLSINLTKWSKDDSSITLNVTSITINNSSWKITDYNLLIDNCNLQNFQIIFGHKISNRMSPNIKFSLMNSSYSAINLPGTVFQPFIRVTKGSANFKNVTIHETFSNKGGSVIKAEESSLYFLGCNLFNNNVKASFFNVSRNSMVKMEECTFTNNNSTQLSFIVITDSTSYFKNCNFTNNMGNNGGIIFGTQNNIISIETCHFTRNSATKGGGSIATYNNTLLNITKSSFTANLAGMFGGILYSKNNNTIYVANCVFLGNVAQFQVAVLEVLNIRRLHIVHCMFQSNEAPFGYALLVSNATLVIESSTFLSNKAEVSSGAVILYDAVVNATNITFTNNTAKQGSCFQVVQNSKIILSQLKFYSNKDGMLMKIEAGSSLEMHDCEVQNHFSYVDSLVEIISSNLIMSNCTFLNNRMGNTGGIFYISRTSEVVVLTSIFEENSATYGAVFYLSVHSMLTIENCHFRNNSALYGGVLCSFNSTVTVKRSVFFENEAYGKGGAIEAFWSNICIYGSKFRHHNAYIGGVCHINSSNIVVKDSQFDANSAFIGGAIYKSYLGNMSLYDCTLTNNEGHYGGTIYILESDFLRFTKTQIIFDHGGNSEAIDFGIYTSIIAYTVHFYTLNLIIQDEKKVVYSNETGIQKLLGCGMISNEGVNLLWQETEFASGK